MVVRLYPAFRAAAKIRVASACRIMGGCRAISSPLSLQDITGTAEVFCPDPPAPIFHKRPKRFFKGTDASDQRCIIPSALMVDRRVPIPVSRLR